MWTRRIWDGILWKNLCSPMMDNGITLAHLKKIHDALEGIEADIIHIAGSKGKGTTAILLAKILEMHKKKVGLFTSPYLLRKEEMIQVNGVCIRSEHLNACLQKIRKVHEALVLEEAAPPLSEFEEMTLAALFYFAQEHCAYVVLECGWGGENDATNIVSKKVLTILTHIELEHTEILGKSLTEITRNKLGICRPDIPLFTVASQTEEVFEEIAHQDLRPLLAPAYELGFHHPESVGLAISAADHLGFAMDSVLKKELEVMTLPGRFERLPYGPHTLILEGAHTYDSIEYFLERVHAFEQENGLPSPEFGVHILNDKPKDLWALFPRNKMVWIPLKDERASEKPVELEEHTVGEILSTLHNKKTPQFFVFCGSFKLVAAVKRGLSTKQLHDFFF